MPTETYSINYNRVRRVLTNTVATRINIAATAALLAASGVSAVADAATAKTWCKGQNECKCQSFVSNAANGCVAAGGSLTEAK